MLIIKRVNTIETMNRVRYDKSRKVEYIEVVRDGINLSYRESEKGSIVSIGNSRSWPATDHAVSPRNISKSTTRAKEFVGARQ